MKRTIINLLSSLFLAINALTVTAADGSKSLEEIAIHPERSASATALSLNESTLSSELLAKVKTIHARVSQQVKKGELLLSLDCEDHQLILEQNQAAVEAAKARLQLAENQLQRNEQLLKNNLSSQELSDTRKTEVKTQRATLKQQQLILQKSSLDVSRCEIKSPFNGIVTERLISEGQLATVSTPLLTVVETDRLELSARVNIQDASWLPQVRQLYFDFGEQVPVSIFNIGNAVDSQSRNQEVRLVFTDDTPLPGTAGKLIWSDPRSFVPEQFIVKRDNQYGVFINDNGTARFVTLENVVPGRPHPVDLPLDTQIVTSNIGMLKNGDQL